MASGDTFLITLGCDPTIDLEVITDGNKLVFRFVDPSQAMDIDGLFFNLTPDAEPMELDVFPFEGNLPITGFDNTVDSVNHLDNGAMVQQSFDVGVQFGSVEAGSTAGDVQAPLAFTIQPMDYTQTLSIEDIDFTNITVVIDSDTGNGQALVGNPSDSSAPTTELVTEVALQEDFNHLWYPSQSDAIESSNGWYVHYGQLVTDGCNDGKVTFASVEANAGVSLTFDARTWDVSKFENEGWAEDSFRVEVQLDNGEWVLLDEFQVNDAGTKMVGSITGQTFGDQSSTLTYEGGILDTVEESAQFRVVSDISAGDEYIKLDNIKISTTNEVVVDGDTPPEPICLLEDDFDGLWSADQSDIVEGWSAWDVCYGKLATDGDDDGHLTLKKVAADDPVRFTFDAETPCPGNFENSGYYADSLKVEVQIDGGEWVLLDEFKVNDEGTALVGSKTGQTITKDATTLTYEGGILDTAEQSVQFRFDSDISASNEDILIDNIKVEALPEAVKDDGKDDEVCEDFDDAEAGQDPFDAFSGLIITGHNAGSDPNGPSDAMIFDTANPTGGDWDLGFADQGKAIILSEDGDSSDPDDNAHGGTISFEFLTPSDVQSLNLLDIEEKGGTIDLFDADGNVLNTVEIPAAGNNSVQTIEIATAGVTYMDVNLVGSGAVDDLCYTDPKADDCEGSQYDILFKDDLLAKAEEVVDETEEELDDVIV